MLGWSSCYSKAWAAVSLPGCPVLVPSVAYHDEAVTHVGMPGMSPPKT